MVKPVQLSLFPTGPRSSSDIPPQVQLLSSGTTGTMSDTAHLMVAFSTHQMTR